MGFMYAATNDQGLLIKVVDFLDELTWDQKVELGVKDFVDEDLPPDFDLAIQKVGDIEIVETTDLIIRRKKVIQKTDEDLFSDKMMERQMNLPLPEVSIIVMARILARMARSMLLQIDPTDPSTHIDIPMHDIEFLKNVLGTADASPAIDPRNPDLPPGGDTSDSTQTLPA